jgi:hypothetical protein
MPCGRQASDTFRPLFLTSPRMRMICSALCFFYVFVLLVLPRKTPIEKRPHHWGQII